MKKALSALALLVNLGLASLTPAKAQTYNYFPAAGSPTQWTVYRSDGNYAGYDTNNGFVPNWNTSYLWYSDPTTATNLAWALQNKQRTGASATALQRAWQPVGSGGYFKIFYQDGNPPTHVEILCTLSSNGSQFFSGSGCGWGGSGYETQFNAPDSLFISQLPN